MASGGKGKEQPEPEKPDLEARIKAELKSGPEQEQVVGPLVMALVKRGWRFEQIRYGKHEWRVPKNPSQAAQREAGHSFEGWPCDIAVFDDPAWVGDPSHILFIVETKQPDEQSGVSQLEQYLSNEPHAKLGVWTNTPDPSAEAVFVFRDSGGRLVRRRRLIADLPNPGDPIQDGYKRMTFKDLERPSREALKQAFEELLDQIVVVDSRVTRREDQLEQLCNIILLKLQSDKLARMEGDESVRFRRRETPEKTGEAIREQFARLVKEFPDTFVTQQDREIRLTDETIDRCVARLERYNLLDVGLETVSYAFQVLRSAALRQAEGQYFTPYPVVRAGIRLLQVKLDDLVIDPACGTGSFLLEVLADIQRRHPGANVAQWAQTHVYGVDKDAIAVKLTKAVMQIAGDGSAHVFRGDSLRSHLWKRDFPHLDVDLKPGRFSVVVTNPPFGRNLRLTGEELRLMGSELAQSSDGAWRDLEIGLVFLEQAYRLLQRGGRVGIILPETYFFSSSYAFVLKWLKNRLHPVAVANVPMEAFQGFCRAKTNFYVFVKM